MTTATEAVKDPAPLRVSQPLLFQRLRDVLLPDDGVEILRTIFAGEDLIIHGG